MGTQKIKRKESEHTTTENQFSKEESKRIRKGQKNYKRARKQWTECQE